MFALFGSFFICLVWLYFIFSFALNRKLILVLKENIFIDCFGYFVLVFVFTDALTHFELLEYLPPVFFFWWFISMIFSPIDLLIDFSRNAFKD